MTAPRPRRLWLCADDYGISPGVNRAILDLIGSGRINATSVMVASPGVSAADADALAALAGHRQPSGRRVAIGLHFTLTAPFRPITSGYAPITPQGAFLSLRRTLAVGLARRLDAEALAAEAANQLAAFTALFGRPPDFVDGHQHVQLLPQVTDALLAAMPGAAPGAWIRQCGRASPRLRRWRDHKGLLLDVLSGRLRTRCAAAGIATNPAFAGTYSFRGDADYEEMFGSFLEALPDGGVVMCHPGFVDAQLQRLDDLTGLREREYRYFAGDRFPQLLESRGVVLA